MHMYTLLRVYTYALRSSESTVASAPKPSLAASPSSFRWLKETSEKAKILGFEVLWVVLGFEVL